MSPHLGSVCALKMPGVWQTSQVPLASQVRPPRTSTRSALLDLSGQAGFLFWAAGMGRRRLREPICMELCAPTDGIPWGVWLWGPCAHSANVPQGPPSAERGHAPRNAAVARMGGSILLPCCPGQAPESQVAPGGRVDGLPPTPLTGWAPSELIRIQAHLPAQRGCARRGADTPRGSCPC